MQCTVTSIESQVGSRVGFSRETVEVKYPEVPLTDARARLRDARAMLASGMNPHHEQQKEKLVLKEKVINTFSAIAQEWFDSKKNLRSKPWRDANDLYLRRDLNPDIGNPWGIHW